jgi:hypothetical protein
MKLVQKRSYLLILALVLAYAGLSFAAPVAPMSGEPRSSTAAQPEPKADKPVDCKKYPKDPSCKKTQ